MDFSFFGFDYVSKGESGRLKVDFRLKRSLPEVAQRLTARYAIKAEVSAIAAMSAAPGYFAALWTCAS